MRIQLISGWRTWWRWWSTWLTAAAALIFNLDTVEYFLHAYNALPTDFKLAFTPEAQRVIGSITLAVGFLARFPRQRKTHAIAERDKALGENA